MQANVSTFASVAAASILGLLALTGIIVGTAIGVARPGRLDLAPGGAGAGPLECGAFANLASDVKIDCEAVPLEGACDEQNRCVISDANAFADNANSVQTPEPVVCDSLEVAELCAAAGGEERPCSCAPRLCVRESNRAGSGEDLFTCNPLFSAELPPETPDGFACGRFTDVPFEEQPIVLDCALRPFTTLCLGAPGCTANGVLGDSNQLGFNFASTNVCGAGSNDACLVDDQSCDCNEVVACVRNVRGQLQTFQCTPPRG